MRLKYLRFAMFRRSVCAFSAYARRRRMKRFIDLTRIRQDARILDLGGAPGIWRDVPFALDITILNLPGEIERADSTRHAFTYVEGDACDVRQFHDREFDLVFSNSVIEHVGPAARQRAFAREVRRLGRSYWVQTPSKWFPIEAHCGMPLWWFYPESIRQAFIKGWRKKLPAWTEMVEGTRVLTVHEMRSLFPGALTLVEYAMGVPKSYTMYHLDSGAAKCSAA